MKRNKMDLGAILLIIGGVIVAMVIVIFALRANGVLKTSGSGVIEQASETFANYSDPLVSLYDGNVCSGKDVQDCISRYATTDVTVTVKTNANPTGTKYNSATGYAKADAPNDPDHINDNGVFTGKVSMNDNNIVKEVEFTQSKQSK